MPYFVVVFYFFFFCRSYTYVIVSLKQNTRGIILYTSPTFVVITFSSAVQFSIHFLLLLYFLYFFYFIYYQTRDFRWFVFYGRTRCSVKLRSCLYNIIFVHHTVYYNTFSTICLFLLLFCTWWGDSGKVVLPTQRRKQLLHSVLYERFVQIG